MAEKRKSIQTICVKINAKKLFKIEMFPAEQWQESAQAGAACAGRYRLRINRRWHDLPEGGPAYLDITQAYALAATLAVGESPVMDPAPDLPRGTPVSAPNGRTLAGVVMRDVTRTITEPIRAYDGRWYAGVTIIGKGCVMMPVNELIRKGYV